MPWSETTAMSERQRFIEDLESSLFTMTELCGQYGISRKTSSFRVERKSLTKGRWPCSRTICENMLENVVGHELAPQSIEVAIVGVESCLPAGDLCHLLGRF